MCPFSPGAATATEVESALELGLTHLKFFPAEALGGLKMLGTVGSVPHDPLMPTGGISANLPAYLSTSIMAVGGSWMVPADIVQRGEFETIEMLAHEAVKAVEAARPKA